MDTGKIILRIKNIITSPEDEWENIKNEKSNHKDILNEFALPLIILLSITKMLGFIRFGADFSFVAIFVALISFVSFYSGLFLTGLIVKEIAPTFFSNNNKILSFKLVVYSATPILVASIIGNLHPSLLFFKILYLYSAYLVWLGVNKLMETPEQNKLSFVIIIMVVLFGTIEATSKILSILLPVSNAIVG